MNKSFNSFEWPDLNYLALSNELVMTFFLLYEFLDVADFARLPLCLSVVFLPFSSCVLTRES